MNTRGTSVGISCCVPPPFAGILGRATPLPRPELLPLSPSGRMQGAGVGPRDPGIQGETGVPGVLEQVSGERKGVESCLGHCEIFRGQ